MVLPASALTVDDNIVYVHDGHGFFDDESSKFSGDGVYVIVTEEPSNYKIGITGSGISDTTYNIVYSDSLTQRIYCSIVGNDGYLYSFSYSGIDRIKTRDTTTPQYLNDTSDVTTVSADVAFCAAKEGDYIYYVTTSDRYTVKRFNTNTLLVSDYKTTTYPIASFYVYDGEVFYIQYTTVVSNYKMKIYNDDGLFFSSNIGDSGNKLDNLDNFWVQLQRTNNYWFIGAIAHYNNAFYDGVSEVFYSNGTYYTTWSMDYSLKFTDLSVQSGCFYIDSNTPIALCGVDKTSGQLVQTIDTGISTASSSSDSTSSDNPYLDMDGDGEFTQDDAKELSLSLGPLMWILFLMIFLMVALGGRR